MDNRTDLQRIADELESIVRQLRHLKIIQFHALSPEDQSYAEADIEKHDVAPTPAGVFLTEEWGRHIDPFKGYIYED